MLEFSTDIQNIVDIAQVVPLLQFPTTILFIGKNSAFLSKLKLQSTNICHWIHCENTEFAINLLYKQHSAQFNVYHLPMEDDEINFDPMYNFLYDKQRFAAISTIIIDDSISQICSIDFLNKIKALSIKKITLVNSDINYSLISAFNDKIVDYCIIKNTEHCLKTLDHYITASITHYFQELSIKLLATMHLKPRQNTDHFTLRSNFMREYQLAEFYQIDLFGSGIGITREGTQHWLAISDPQQANMYLNIAKDNQAKSKLIKKLSSQEYLLFLASEFERKLSIEYWSDYLFKISHDAQSNSKRLHYTIISDRTFTINCSRIVHYSQFYLE